MSDLLKRVEQIGGSCLIYEGAVLAVRRFPALPQPPAVSDLVWKIRSKTLRFWVGSAVCGYLLWHFLEGDALAQPRS